MKKITAFTLSALTLAALAGCGKAEPPDPMTQPRENTVDPMTAGQTQNVDRNGQVLVPKSATPPPTSAGGQTDRMGNPTGG